MLSEAENLSRRGYDPQNEIAASPGLSSGASSNWASFGDPMRVFGRVQCTCSSFNVGPQRVLTPELREKSRITDIE